VYDFTAFKPPPPIIGETSSVICVDVLNANALELSTMTHAAPTFDMFDDGLVHSHDWSRATPPGCAHGERTHQSSHKDRDESASHDHR
jgi:hypothetical protein